MAFDTIDIGSSPNDGTGDTPRAAGQKINDNFTSAQSQIDLKAPIASPAFTGNPTAPNQSAGTNNTHIANTAYVDAAVAALSTVVSSALVFKGAWDASSGSFPGSGSAQTGYFYKVSVAGTVDGVSFTLDDNIYALVNNASASTYASNWLRIQSSITADEIATALGFSPASDTDGLPEGVINKYATDARTRSVVLTGYAAGSRSALSATDTILAAFNKIGKWLADLGTAAFLNVGTSAGNVVQVQTGGKLPALDASNLTNVPSGSGVINAIAPNASTTPLTITAATGQTARMVEFITPGVPPYPGARSYFGQWGQFETQAWMTISGVYVIDDATGGIKQVVYAGSSPAAPTDYTSNRITGGGNMLGVSCDIVGPSIAIQDNLNQYLGGGAQVATRATVAAGGTGFVVGDVLTVSGGTSVTALAAKLDGVNQSVRGSGYTVGDVLTVVGGTGTAATITVNTVNGSGGILTATLTSAGNYSVNPPVSTYTTGGTGTGAYFYFSWSSRGVAKLRVDTVSGGVITKLSVVRPGLYTALPSNPVTLTGGTGTSATATLEWTLKATKSRYVDFLDYSRTLTNVWGGDGTLTFGYAQDIDLFWQSKANLYWVDNDTLGSDATFKPAGFNISGQSLFGSSRLLIPTQTRTLPTAATNTVDIGTIKLRVNGGALSACFATVTLSSSSGNGVLRRWTFPLTWQSHGSTDGGAQGGSTVGWNNWASVAPDIDERPSAAATYDLDYNQNTTTGDVSVRLRALGSATVTGIIDIELIGQDLDGRFVASTATATGVSVPTDCFYGKGRTWVDRKRLQHFDGGSSDGHYAAPTTGQTLTLLAGYAGCTLCPAGTLSALTLTMPPNPSEGQVYTVTLYNAGITSLTFAASGAGVYGNFVSSAAANTTYRMIFQKEMDRWIRG